MATSKAIRADDVTGLNIATTQIAEDAITKDVQRVVLNNSTDGTMAVVGSAGLKVDPSGATSPVSIAATVNVRPSDGTNPVTKTYDLDSGAGTEWNLGVGLRKAASGGSVEAGTSSDPIRTDPTGTTNQPISASSLPLPTGAATSAKQPALGVAGTASADVITVQGKSGMTALVVDGSGVTQPVSGAFFQATQPVSIAATVVVKADTAGNQANSLKVDGSAVTQPVSGTVTVQQATASNLKVDLSGTGANATAIKTDGSAVTQPVSGTITANQGGTWTVQPGNTANTTAWKVDGSAVTQPVSGTVTANAGTNLNTSALALDATLTGGTTKAIARGGAKGSTTAADVTSTASGANHQPIDVAIYDASGNQVTSFGGGTQYAEGTTQATATGTVALGKDASNVVKPLPLDASGFLKVNVAAGGASGGTSSSFSAAFPATGTAAGASDGTNMQPLLVDGSGNLKVSRAGVSPENLTQVGGAAIALGSAVSASSLPVVVASDQTSLPVLANSIPVVTYSSFTLADANGILWATTMNDAGILVTNQVSIGTGQTFFLNDISAHVSYQITVTTGGLLQINGVTWNPGYLTTLGFTTSSGYQSALYISGGTFLSRVPSPFPSMGLPKNAAQETGGNLALIATLLQNQQKTVDILERILGCLEAHKLMFADVGAGYVDTDETIKNIN